MHFDSRKQHVRDVIENRESRKLWEKQSEWALFTTDIRSEIPHWATVTRWRRRSFSICVYYYWRYDISPMLVKTWPRRTRVEKGPGTSMTLKDATFATAAGEYLSENPLKISLRFGRFRLGLVGVDLYKRFCSWELGYYAYVPKLQTVDNFFMIITFQLQYSHSK